MVYVPETTIFYILYSVDLNIIQNYFENNIFLGPVPNIYKD